MWQKPTTLNESISLVGRPTVVIDEDVLEDILSVIDEEELSEASNAMLARYVKGAEKQKATAGMKLSGAMAAHAKRKTGKPFDIRNAPKDARETLRKRGKGVALARIKMSRKHGHYVEKSDEVKRRTPGAPGPQPKVGIRYKAQVTGRIPMSPDDPSRPRSERKKDRSGNETTDRAALERKRETRAMRRARRRAKSDRDGGDTDAAKAARREKRKARRAARKAARMGGKE